MRLQRIAAIAAWIGVLVLTAASALAAYNITEDLSTTDPGDWLGGFQIQSVRNVSDTILFVTANNGHFGYYNASSNILTDLSGTDAGNWIGTGSLSTIFDSLPMNSTTVYIVGNSGIFGRYDFNTNVTADLRGVDPGDFWGTNALIGYQLARVNSTDILLAGYNGQFARYSIPANTMYDLSGTDAGDWIGTRYRQALWPLNSTRFYFCAQTFFGWYDISTNVSTQSNASICGPTPYEVKALNSTHMIVSSYTDHYLYNALTDAAVSKSSTDPGDWMSTNSISAVGAVNSTSYLIGGQNGAFGLYDTYTDVTQDLRSTDTSNWIGSLTVTAIQVVNGTKAYIGTANGGFGRYDLAYVPSAQSVSIFDNTTFLNCSYSYSGPPESGTSFRWFRNGTTLSSTSQTLASGNYTLNDTLICEVTPKSTALNGTPVNSSSYVKGDSTAPVISSMSVPTSGTISDVLTVTVSCTDQYALQSTSPKVSWINPNGIVEGNFTMVNVSGTYTKYYVFNTVGTYSNFTFYCIDGSGNQATNSSSTTLTITADASDSDSGGGGGGGGGGTTVITSVGGVRVLTPQDQEILQTFCRPGKYIPQINMVINNPFATDTIYNVDLQAVQCKEYPKTVAVGAKQNKQFAFKDCACPASGVDEIKGFVIISDPRDASAFAKIPFTVKQFYSDSVTLFLTFGLGLMFVAMIVVVTVISYRRSKR